MADADDSGGQAPPQDREGFLPIHTNSFDRGFIAAVLLIAIHLLWMRFLEADIPLYFATILSVVVGWIVIKRG